jgi:putative GTP pyrophosphokinase
VLRILRGLNISTQKMGARKNVILSVSIDGKLDLFTYAKGADAIRKYFQLEKLQNGADVVLVKGDTGADIRLSYKNYFSDPNDFLRYVEKGSSKLIRNADKKRSAAKRVAR